MCVATLTDTAPVLSVSPAFMAWSTPSICRSKRPTSPLGLRSLTTSIVPVGVGATKVSPGTVAVSMIELLLVVRSM